MRIDLRIVQDLQEKLLAEIQGIISYLISQNNHKPVWLNECFEGLDGEASDEKDLDSYMNMVGQMPRTASESEQYILGIKYHDERGDGPELCYVIYDWDDCFFTHIPILSQPIEKQIVVLTALNNKQ